MDFEHKEVIELENSKCENEGENAGHCDHWGAKLRRYWMTTLFFGCFLLYSSRSIVSICVVEMAEEYGWDKQLSGIVLSSFFCGYILTQVAGGMLADRYGGEPVLFWSSILWSFSTLCIPLIEDVFHLPFTVTLILFRTVTGAAQGVYFPALVSLLSRRVAPDQSNTAFAVAASGTAVGNIFSGFTGSLLLESSGWRSVFYLTGSMSLIWLFIFKLLMMAVEPIKNTTLTSHKGEKSSVPWSVLAKSCAFWTLLLCGICESLVYTNLLSWLPTYFNDQFHNKLGWLFNVLPWVASFVFQNVGGHVSDKMLANGWSVTKVRKRFVAFAGFVPAVLNLALNYVDTFVSALVLVTILVGCMSTNSSGLAMNPRDLCPEHAGSMFGLMNTMAAASGTIGVYFTGYVLDTTMQWSSVFQMSSFFLFFGASMFVLFGSGERLV